MNDHHFAKRTDQYFKCPFISSKLFLIDLKTCKTYVKPTKSQFYFE